MATNIITKSAEETKKVAEELATEISGPTVITLSGDLGAGKTTFVQGFAKALGLERKILSPTFIIVREYELGIKNQESRIKDFYHIDLYRLESESQIESIGLLDILKRDDSIVLIEWPEKMGNLLPNNRIDIQFEYIDENERNIIINNRMVE